LRARSIFPPYSCGLVRFLWALLVVATRLRVRRKSFSAVRVGLLFFSAPFVFPDRPCPKAFPPRPPPAIFSRWPSLRPIQKFDVLGKPLYTLLDGVFFFCRVLLFFLLRYSRRFPPRKGRPFLDLDLFFLIGVSEGTFSGPPLFVGIVFPYEGTSPSFFSFETEGMFFPSCLYVWLDPKSPRTPHGYQYQLFPPVHWGRKHRRTGCFFTIS